MKKYQNIILSVLLVNLLCPLVVLADIRIAYVDLEKALSGSKAGMQAQKEYEAEVKNAQTDLDKKKKEFQRSQEDMSKARASLSDDARVQREEKLMTLEKDLKRTLQDSQESLRRKNAKLVGDLVKKLRDVVNEVGKKEGFTVILEKSSQSVLYADASIDITDKVVQAFDQSNGG